MPEAGSASYTSVTCDPIIPNSVSTPSLRSASTRSRPPLTSAPAAGPVISAVPPLREVIGVGGREPEDIAPRRHAQPVEPAMRTVEIGGALVRLQDMLLGGAGLAQGRCVT